MSSSASRGGGERMIHQDFIARIRFSNTLPPPPNPPKLLEIPNTGLSSGQYTNPGFASRLAREQPLNIEADAELGMPLDLVGMPGVFDGDESSIQAPPHNPAVSPHDRPLLRPLATLGKPKMNDTAVSFLRKTEYIATRRGPSDTAAFLRPGARRPGAGAPVRRAQKRASPEIDEDAGTPAHVKRKIAQSFKAAAHDLTDPAKHVRHPRSRPGAPSRVTVVSALPLLPDLDAFPDSGAYLTIKFHNPPLAGVPGADDSTYDTRLQSSVMIPVDRSDEEERRFAAALEAWERDPKSGPRPTNPIAYDFFLPQSAEVGAKFRRRFDVADPDRDDDSLYTTSTGGRDDKGCFRFPHMRRFETSDETELTHDSKYDVEVILSLADDGGEGVAGPAALMYPVMQRTTIRSQRGKNIARTRGLGLPDDDEQQGIERLDITVEDPAPEVAEVMEQFKTEPRPFQADDDNDEEKETRPGDDGEGGTQQSSGRARSPASANGADSDEQDAEGDEE
ncbi:hypothetical protein RB594_007436 [Gaeumannomyces avenae]